MPGVATVSGSIPPAATTRLACTIVSERIGESSSVSILDGDDIVYVARASQRKVMSIALMPGSRLPAYCTSMGRAMLAAMPVDHVETMLKARDLPARTIHTLTSPQAILLELEKVRAQGYALIDQEVELGLRSIAVLLLPREVRSPAPSM